MKGLYILSKTDYHLISRCNTRTKMHQRGLGLFVLLTASFAFFAGYYALTTIFGYWDEYSQTYVLSYKERLIVVVCAFLYAMLIASIDREIVSAKSKYAALLRIPLAIAIGIVIAFMYWFMYGFCLSLGYGAILPPIISAWAANLFFVCFGILYLANTE